MNRRSFLKASSLVAGAAWIAPSTYGQAKTAALASRRFPMNRGWLFHPVVTAGDTAVEFDDNGFTSVVLPHTNKVLPWHSFDDARV